MKQITITSTFKIVEDIPKSSGIHNASVNRELSRFASVLASNTSILTGFSASEYSIVTFVVGEEALNDAAPGTREIRELEPPKSPEKVEVNFNPQGEQSEAQYNRPPGKRKPFGA